MLQLVLSELHQLQDGLMPVFFLMTVKHFIECSKSTSQNKTLLLMDNHEAHNIIEVNNHAKDYCVVPFTIPPHCSKKLQPLDNAFGPSKRAYRACLVIHPGKSIIIHNISELVDKAYPLAVRAKKILSGFSSAGLFPHNNNAYSDANFIAANITCVSSAYVADKSTTEHVILSQSIEANKSRPFVEKPQPGCSKINSSLVKNQKVDNPVLS